ncbi:MAG: glycosyltransferase family 2 protein [Candidatus Zapsychrus exili]|nr:glycosyltransferase family 2 protein [Candidatus Zapsychrus exili]
MENDIRKPKSISVIAPAYNEELLLSLFCEKTCSVLELIGIDYEVLILENGSTDNSLEILKSLRAKNPRIQYLSFSRNFGHQGAILAGLQNCRGDVVISMDADLQHPPEMIPDMLSEWGRGFDIVYTTKRNKANISFVRRFADKAFYRLMNWITGIELKGHSDFRLLDRKVVNVISSLPERNKFLRGLVCWVGFSQVGLPYDVIARSAGKSKFSLKQLFRLTIDGIFSFSIVPLRFFTLVGLLVSMFSFCYGFYYIVLKVAVSTGWSQSILPSGWTSLIFGMAFLGGIQLLGIGLLGEYLGRVYDEVKKRPNYIIQESSLS